MMLTSSSPLSLLPIQLQPNLLLPSPKNYKNTPRITNNRNRRIVLTCCSSSSTTDPLTSLGRLLWGPSLPPHLLISAARTAWSATWHLMMRQLAPSSSSSYTRPSSQFPTVPSPYYAHPTNLTLYAAFPCPWAHRALILVALKNPNPSSISLSIATPALDGAWEVKEEEEGVRITKLKEVYGRRRGGYSGRATVPMLWDSGKGEVVCNESYGIIQFLNSANFGGREEEEEEDGGERLDLAPEELRGGIERWNGIIYPNVNNGVYRCGFAQSQEAYNTAVNDLFNTLDMLESHLSTSRYLCGDAFTLADVCLFTTLIRFDPVYNVLFKCTKKKLVEYPNLHAYTRDIYQIPKVAETCNFEAIMDGYYQILFPLNPGSIRPILPSSCEHEYLSQPHNRESLSSSSRKMSQLHAV